MKTTLRFLVVLSLLPGGQLLAAGGGTAQGTLFSGQGLDWQRTATEAQPHWHLKLTPFPLQPTAAAGAALTVHAANITVIGCTQISPMILRCQTSVLLAANHPPSKFCGKWLDRKTPQTVYLYAFSGHVDPSGLFVFETPLANIPATPPTQSPKVTLACGMTTQSAVPDEEEWSALGALGKCMDWPNESGGYGYPPVGAAGASLPLFQSCIRMVRGDYCGDGVSHTKDSTLIDPYRTSFLLQHTVQPAFLLEANWSPVGALCIVHTRYVALPAACQDKFPVALDVLAKPQRMPDGGVTGMRGADYWCRKGVVGSLEQNCVTGGGPPQPCPWFKQVRTALQQGLLVNDSLLQP